MKHNLSIIIVASLLATVCAPLRAGQEVRQNTEPLEQQTPLTKWWNGPGLTSNWLGIGDHLEDVGLKVKGRYIGAFYGVVHSQGGSRGFFDQDISFSAEWNMGKLFKADALRGVKAFAGVRWRDPRGNSNANEFVQASSMFSPTHFQSGTQWRFLTVGMEVGSGDLLPVKDMVVLRGGWIQPQKEFLDQPLSKLFLNNAVESSKGVGGNIPFSSSFSTWGATLRVKPVDWAYVKAGMFMAYPKGTSTSNHGLAFEGYGPDSSQNGLMVMGETGVTPKFGSAQLPGKYAFGGYYWGNEKDSFNGTSHFGQFGFYLQADQMVYREPSAEEPIDKDGFDGKSFKAPVDTEKPKLSDQGLSIFSVFSFAPEYNNLYSFYFQSGLSYKGLIPGRDKDQTLFSIAYGNYSGQSRIASGTGITSTTFLEWGYRVQINTWSFIQPFAQYVVRPNGSSDIKNAAILGVCLGVNF